MAGGNPFVFHINTALTHVSAMYRNAAFVAASIFPTVPVSKQSDDFFTYGTDNLRSRVDALAPRSKTKEIIMQRSATPYAAKGHGLNFPIPDEDRASDDLGTLEIDGTLQVTDGIMLNREIDIVAQLNAGLPGGNIIDLSATSYANAWDQDTIDPITVIAHKSLSILMATGKKPNLLVLSSSVLQGMRNNAKVKTRITGAPNLDGSKITLQQIANVCDVETCLEASAVQNTAKEGQADSLSLVWGNTALLCYVPPSPALRTLSLGYHFMWNFLAIAGKGDSPAPVGSLVSGGAGYGIRMYREEPLRTTVVEAVMYYAQQLVTPTAGVLWNNAVQNWP